MFIVGQIKCGKISYDIAEMKNMLLTLPDGRVAISIGPLSLRKTKEQLGYFFAGIVKDAAEHFGWDSEEMYKWLISECNRTPVVNKFTGEINYVGLGLSHCDKGQMMAVIEKAIRLLAEHGFVVKTPEEYLNNE